MKNMDVFNIESVCLLLLFLLLFKLGFAEYSKKCIYILKKTKNTKKTPRGWPLAGFLCCGVLLSGFDGERAQLPAPRTVQYCGCTHSKSSYVAFFLLLKTC